LGSRVIFWVILKNIRVFTTFYFYLCRGYFLIWYNLLCYLIPTLRLDLVFIDYLCCWSFLRSTDFYPATCLLLVFFFFILKFDDRFYFYQQLIRLGIFFQFSWNIILWVEWNYQYLFRLYLFSCSFQILKRLCFFILLIRFKFTWLLSFLLNFNIF
jgi:hypothetical protein